MQTDVVTDSKDRQEVSVSLADKLIYQYFVWKEKESFLKELGKHEAAYGVSLCLSSISSLLIEEGVEISGNYVCQNMYKNRLYIIAQNIVTDNEAVAYISTVMGLSEKHLYETYYAKVNSVILEDRKIERELLEVALTGLCYEPFVTKIKKISSVLSLMGLQTAGNYDLNEMTEILRNALI